MERPSLHHRPPLINRWLYFDEPPRIMPEEPDRGLTVGGIRVSKKLSTVIGTGVYMHFTGREPTPEELQAGIDLFEKIQANVPLLIVVGIYLLSQGAVDVAKALRK